MLRLPVGGAADGKRFQPADGKEWPMATIEELEERKARLEAQIARLKRMRSAEERKARNHALAVVGGLVVRHAPDGDWRSIDWDALAELIAAHANEIASCSAERLDTDAAKRRLREWERGGSAQSEN